MKTPTQRNTPLSTQILFELSIATDTLYAPVELSLEHTTSVVKATILDNPSPVELATACVAAAGYYMRDGLGRNASLEEAVAFGRDVVANVEFTDDDAQWVPLMLANIYLHCLDADPADYEFESLSDLVPLACCVFVLTALTATACPDNFTSPGAPLLALANILDY